MTSSNKNGAYSGGTLIFPALKSMDIMNDASFSTPQEDDGSRLDSGMLIDCDDECP